MESEYPGLLPTVLRTTKYGQSIPPKATFDNLYLHNPVKYIFYPHFSPERNCS